jgi:hypothetical protein
MTLSVSEILDVCRRDRGRTSAVPEVDRNCISKTFATNDLGPIEKKLKALGGTNYGFTEFTVNSYRYYQCMSDVPLQINILSKPVKSRTYGGKVPPNTMEYTLMADTVTGQRTCKIDETIAKFLSGLFPEGAVSQTLRTSYMIGNVRFWLETRKQLSSHQLRVVILVDNVQGVLTRDSQQLQINNYAQLLGLNGWEDANG